MSIYLQFTYLIIQLMTFSISNYGLRMDFLSIGCCKQTNKQGMTTKERIEKD